MGTSTNAVPLTYQPMMGKTPNASRNQGITTRTVSHSNIENTAKIDVEAVSPIGGGIACICVCMCSTQFTEVRASERFAHVNTIWRSL